jgi:hypothetical protein
LKNKIKEKTMKKKTKIKGKRKKKKRKKKRDTLYYSYKVNLHKKKIQINCRGG